MLTKKELKRRIKLLEDLNNQLKTDNDIVYSFINLISDYNIVQKDYNIFTDSICNGSILQIDGGNITCTKKVKDWFNEYKK